MGAFVEHRAPEPYGFIDFAALGGEHGEVATGLVPVDPHVQAGELFRPAQAQDLPPARLGLGRLTAMSVDDCLAEQEFGILGIEREPLLAGPERGGGVAQHLVRPGDQGEQLPRDRVAGRRPRQAAAEVFQGLGPFATLDGDRAEIEQHEGIVGPGLQLLAEDPRVAVELPAAEGGIDIAGVSDDQVRPSDRDPGAAERG